MFSEIKRQHIIVFIVMLAVLFGAGVKYGRGLEETSAAPVTVVQADDREISSTEEEKEVTVHVAGFVFNPGVFTFKEGSRVIDAVEKAQPKPEADLDALNLAKKLVDQERVVVPCRMEAGSSPGIVIPTGGQSDGQSASGGQTVNINTAGEAELETLPGIGPAKAKAIIQYREETGFFNSIEEIEEVPGIGPATFNNLKDKIMI
ncbi:MAG: helix-hairpin-helix domain-containing protein [Desulfitobacteriaceae bacterium]|nr:helix-hairpin-helix domain-containing protein [Desulfitobacteriaceae bacterium]MDD4752397.1 helix-hairpin-helix domain-containing protein [Desulfitobacteriaceae bacterium]